MKTLLLLLTLINFAFADISIFSPQHKKLGKITTQDLANLYLKKITKINGFTVTPIDSPNKKVFKEFYKKIVKKNPKQLRAYWMKQIYTGNTQPPKKLSTQALKKEMKKNTFIIAYGMNSQTGQLNLILK